MKYLFRFILICVLLTAVLIPFNYFVLDGILDRKFDYTYYLAYGYFLVLTIVIQGLLLKSLSERPQKFVVNFMAAMGGKIFLSLILILLHLYFNKEGAKVFAVNFTVLYLLYSFLGIYHILSVQRKTEG